MIQILILLFMGMASVLAQSANLVLPAHTAKTSLSGVVGLESQLKKLQLEENSVLTGLPTRKKDIQYSIPFLEKSGFEIKEKESFLRINPLLGLEQRIHDKTNDNVRAIDGGLWLHGQKANLSFYLDARIFTEDHSQTTKESWDGEFIEIQEADVEGNATSANVSFVSFARYRANIDYTGEAGSIGFRRDNVVWGPGQEYNLVFGPKSVPFSHLYYQLNIGNFRVYTLWGRLGIEGDETFGYSKDTRSVYAHRYEWQYNNFLIGLSEQTILYETEQFSALFPIVPLFMDKGQGLERNNNGNIALDLSYRFSTLFMVFGEFLVDDLQEPSTLFDNFWGNRWGAMAGVRGVYPIKKKELYYNMEWSRIEPWVYTHYYARTAQATHRGIPIGNTIGPHSQALSFRLEYGQKWNWLVGARMEVLWKGKTIGSNAEDPVINRTSNTKDFLKGVDDPIYMVEPKISYKWNFLTFETKAEIRKNSPDSWYRFRIHAEY